MRMRLRATSAARNGLSSPALSGAWTPLGPAPLASDASGNGTQDYRQVTGRATSIAIDPADPTGNAIYIGGAQGGVWKSTNAAASNASSVTWAPLTDNQATLAIGTIAIQPGNSNPATSLILAGTGEGNNSADSYFGMGILRSANGGNSWTLISGANGGLSFSGLGTAHIAFGPANTVVAAMVATPEGIDAAAVTSSATPGLYTSLDAGQTWTYNALLDPGSEATDANSATSVVYNATAGLFFAAIRYHGFYFSPDGVNWTRLASQPGGSLLNVFACPPQSSSNHGACPIYRSELSVVPGRNEMYAWYVSLDAAGDAIDQSIWLSTNGGATWTQINDAGLTNCGDFEGCGVTQGDYNLELLAVPNGSTATDLYAGAVNLYKCSINLANPTCGAQGFLNLTHAYGCDPIAAPAHVHPAQHAIAFTIPASGNAAGNALLYFANDGGVYRALNGFTGLNSGSCTSTNQFDDLNQNLGSLMQFVSFAQHPSDPNTLLGGAQGNGSPATESATTNTAWISVNGGDGGYNAIDPFAVTNWYVSNPDVPPGGLNILECGNGVNCVSADFNAVVGSSDLGGDDGGFYFPYILDPQSSSGLLVGTCRVWRGPRVGGSFTPLSPNFDTLGSGACTGNEVNVVRAIAVGGSTDTNGSMVVYATTDGPGPLNAATTSPAGGNAWVTTNATAGPGAFTQVTQNINPNQFPISSVAIDPSDASGNTAYVTIMGFTGGPGHVWKTTNAGASWIDFSGGGYSALPDAPTNVVLVDSDTANIYVGTDVGVFASGTSTPAWKEVGPAAGLTGFLPNVTVTALALFNSNGQKLLRASTYGRGIWQLNPTAQPDFALAISNSPQTVFVGTNASFLGNATSLNGYGSPVTLSCVAGATPVPNFCVIPASPVTPTPSGAPFNAGTGGTIGDYSFNLLGIGSDPGSTTHQVGVVLHVVDWALSAPLPNAVTVPRGNASAPVSFQMSAAGSFNQAVTLSCTVNIPSAICNLTPGTAINLAAGTPVNVTASLTVPADTTPSSYIVTIEATTAGASPLSTTFTLTVTTNPDFVLSELSPFPSVNAGSNATSGPINIASQDGFSNPVTLACSPSNMCSGVSPSPANSFPATANVTVHATALNAGSYQLSVQGVSGLITHTITVPFNVGDYQLSGPASLTLSPSAQATVHLTITPSTFYNSQVSATCDASALPGTTCLPTSPVTVTAGSTATVAVTMNIPNDAAIGNHTINFHTQDLSGTPSHSVAMTLTIAPDFSINSSTLSQTVVAGQTTGPYNLTVAPIGASFNNAVTLTCSGLPALTQCFFNPSSPVTPGNSSAAIVMTITTIAAAPSHRHRVNNALILSVLLWPGIVLICGIPRTTARHNHRAIGFIAALVLLAFALSSCGGASAGGNGGSGQPGTKPGNYTFTVTGTAGPLQHSITLGLNVTD
jgi:hypothetical protein